MKNLYNQKINNKQNISFTSEEAKSLEQFIEGDVDYNSLNKPLQEALLKIGMVIPLTNRAGLGKSIRSLLGI